jgi:murein DD-endopeptidase MepM/ murein hydrolase activator NlpD
MSYDVVKQLEDAIRRALGVAPAEIPLSLHQRQKSVSPHGHDAKELNVTSPFGNRHIRGKENFHRGVDIGLAVGSPVHAVDSGIVKWSGWQDPNNHDKGGGIYVKISHADGKDSFYMHLSKTLVNVGDKVRKGQIIGYSGNTGDSTGPHLHLELRNYNSPRPATAEEIEIAKNGKSEAHNA